GLRLSPDVPGLVAAVAVEGARRLAAPLAEEGGMEFPAALRAAGEADSGHGPSLLRHLGKDCRGPAANYGPADLSPQQPLQLLSAILARLTFTPSPAATRPAVSSVLASPPA